jgi:hypothetical protein
MNIFHVPRDNPCKGGLLPWEYTRMLLKFMSEVPLAAKHLKGVYI